MEIIYNAENEENERQHGNSDRKTDHINLSGISQTVVNEVDSRFYYEPMVSGFPVNQPTEISFAGKKLRVPIWVSSMTGGNRLSGTINRNLAMACKEFGMGMGLGSCRMLLRNDTFFSDFNLRPTIGDDVPFFANLGIAQLEQMIERNEIDPIRRLIGRLSADGLIIHVNPLQEWVQPEGNIIRQAPADTIEKLLNKVDFPVIVKEVGQGFGPVSIRRLLSLPLAAIEFGAFGGTNFSKVEIHRSAKHKEDLYHPFVNVGVTAEEMVGLINQMIRGGEKFACNQLIISGGIRNYLDGYYLTQKSIMPSIYAQAAVFLKHSQGDYVKLQEFIQAQVEGYKMAKCFLTLKDPAL